MALKAVRFIKNRVSVIIPNWNGIMYLEACLKSMQRNIFTDYELIVVDNGSKDGSVKLVETSFPDVKMISFKKNKGFAAACNAGIKAASGEYIALINNDVEIESDYFAVLIETLRQDPQCGMASGKMLNAKHREMIDAAGDAFSAGGAPTNRGHNQLDNGQFDQQKYVFGACAGAAVYRRSLFDEIGFFDEDYFAYMEDVDLDFRSLLAGYKALYVPSAKCYHHGSATLGALSPRHVFLTNRNKLFTIVKNYKRDWLIVHFMDIISHQIDMARQFSQTRRGFSFLRSRISAAWKMPKMVLKRYSLFIHGHRDWDNAYNNIDKR